MCDIFDMFDLLYFDDCIVNGMFELVLGELYLFVLFMVVCVDFLLYWLCYYMVMLFMYFQNYVFYMNYQFYIDEFVKFGCMLMIESDDFEVCVYCSEYSVFVELGDVVMYNVNFGSELVEGIVLLCLLQMFVYYLKCVDGSGIMMVNIGVGLLNVKMIIDYIVVLCLYVWVMFGYCVGLCNMQCFGDYVFVYGYVWEDYVFDVDLLLWVLILVLVEVQFVFECGVVEVMWLEGVELKWVMCMGMVVSVDNCNWELCDYCEFVQWLLQSCVIVFDMESVMIVVNGFCFWVLYGMLLCVLDKLLYGELKLLGMVDMFYCGQVDQYLQIGVKVMEILCMNGFDKLYSCKLWSFVEVVFQ